MYALILDGVVVQVDAEPFPVAAPLEWVASPPETTRGWVCADGIVSPPPPPSADELWAALRAERDMRLIASDIMVAPDRWAAYDEATRTAWAAYRQKLRDLPEATTDPAHPTWPEVPAS